MPFKSEKQRRYLWANEPEVAREFADAEKREGRRQRRKPNAGTKRKRRRS